MTASERPTIIGLVGYKRAGKTTVAEILVEEHGFTELTFAGPLKRALREINPIFDVGDWGATFRLGDLGMTEDELKSSAWGGEYRRLLEALGQSIRAIDPDFWIKALEREVGEAVLVGGVKRIVISDVCFVNEAVAVEAMNGSLVTVSRPAAGPQGLESEELVGLANLTWVPDHELDNDGAIDDLRAGVAAMLEQGWGIA